ncbi:glycosyltransferase family 2 protein [Flavobacterium sp. H122]|uniref:glycosyltransferase family 2 protein n=1 Tax=Flavobacterium sp. H122 TaxID=2529860 RepID=UPI0010AAE00D|nr:glycosyltransferase family A protein [Flavobacterium sp. H122]
MREGINPQKLEKKLELDKIHRIVVVVYIPELTGFYKNSFEVFKLCIDSLISTIDKHAAVTVVNNGSCAEVYAFLNDYLHLGKIDSVIHHRTNIGKIDAQIGAARGVREKLITLTDSDILFKAGWQMNVEKVFHSFNGVGSVSPIPVKDGLFYGTTSVLKAVLLRKVRFKRESIPGNFDDYNKYLNSINWDLETDKDKKWTIIYSGNTKAVIGSGHQVLTVDRDILFKTVPTKPSLTLVGGDSEFSYVDAPIDKAGKMRLSTYNNYAFHMGNNLEPWMIDVQKDNEKSRVEDSNLDMRNTVSVDLLNTRFKDKFFGLKKRIVKKIFALFYN